MNVKIVKAGKAGSGQCTPEELEAIRAQQEREKEPIIGYWEKYAKYRELDPAEAAGLLGLEGARQPDLAQNPGFDQGETVPRLRRRGDSGGKM